MSLRIFLSLTQFMEDQRSKEGVWLTLLRERPQEGLRCIFDAYYQPLCRSIFLLVRDRSVAEDLAQEVFVQLWNRREELEVNTSLWAYLKRSGHNRALNRLRDQKLRREREAAAGRQQQGAEQPRQRLEEAELQQKVQQAVDALPPRTRLVFVLSRFEGYSQKQIAEELGISVKTVENQMTRALRLLREMLKDQLPLKKKDQR